VKHLITYQIFESQITDDNFWSLNWKSMPEWKTLSDLGFYDATTPIQAKNRTIMIKNDSPLFNHIYPAGIVLQQSGYIRDKAATSGFIKSYKSKPFSLKTLFDWVINRFKDEINRNEFAIKSSPELSSEQIRFINKLTKVKGWKYDPVKKEVNVPGEVIINGSILDLFENGLDLLYSIKFGKVKGDFAVIGLGLSDLSFLPHTVKNLHAGGNNITDLKNFPNKFNMISVISSPYLKSLSGLNIEGGDTLVTSYFSIYNLSLVTLIEKLEEVKDDDCLTDSAKQKAISLIQSILKPEEIAPFFKKNIMLIHILDPFPDLKRDVLKITGLRDISKLSKSFTSGLI
jgi:hypothetical protein